MNKLHPVETGSSNIDYVAERLVRLVSVGLKEATMDSPSFRASLNYMHLTVLRFSTQLEKSIIILSKYIQSLNGFIRISKDVENLFLSYIDEPQFISNDISKPCINSFLRGQQFISQNIASLLEVDDSSLLNIKELLEIDIPRYFELRRNFEKIQNKYDIISAKYMQIPKSYDPSKTREDALQLFEIRKQYIHISMSLWICTKKFEFKVGKAATDTCESFWNLNDNPSSNSNDELSEIIESIKQLSLCTRLQQASNNLLMNDLNKARLNSEDGAIKMYTPGLNIKDFDSSILNSANIYLNDENNSNSKLLEKHGWVFIKSNKLQGKGDVWIKRWMFIKNGVFGFLSISNDGQYVQESDKFGVLLVTVNYYPDENRKFVFKISSPSLSLDLILQVETSIELKSWLTVFKNVKQLSIDQNSKIAVNRYTPSLTFLKMVPVVAKDLELVSNNNNPEVEKTSKLIELQLSNLKFNLSVNAPLVTSMTQKLAMAHLYLSSTNTPSATTANFWGYVNWGLYFVLDEENKAKIIAKMKNKPPISIVNLRYSDYYPEKLRVADAELRSIFEVYINEDEFTLLRFNASWSPNNEQKLFCTVYITSLSLYVYSHTYGLTSILPLSLTNFLDIETRESGDYKFLKIHFINGLSFKLQLYAENINIIKTKFNYILDVQRDENKRSNLKLIVQQLLNIEQSYEDEKHNNKVHKHNDNINSIQSDFLIRDAKVYGISEFNLENKVDYSQTMKLLLSKKVNIPAKALFHVLFGDDSSMLQGILPLSSTIFKDDKSSHGLWRCSNNQTLTRVVWNSVFKIPCALQKVEKIINNEYYNIEQETPYLRFVFGLNKKIYMRFIIYNIDSRHCKFLIYYSIGFDHNKNLMNWFTKKVINQIMFFRMEALEEKLDYAIKVLNQSKTSKKIAYAVQTFGPITKYDDNSPTTEELMFGKSINFLPLQLFSSFYYEKLNYEFERYLIRSVKFVSAFIRSFIKFLNMNWILLSVLVISICFNIFLSGRSTSSYWRERNINNRINLLMGNKYHIERSISLSEIDNMLYPNNTNLSYLENGTEVYWKFLESEDLLSSHSYSTAETSNNDDYGGDEHEHKRMKLLGQRELSMSKKLTGLRIERNEILSKLNLLNYIEHEFILKEWKDWISSELSNCEKVKKMMVESWDGVKEYCDDVELEMINFYENLL